MSIPMRHSVSGGQDYTIQSGRDADRIRKILGLDPNIHSGMAGRGKSVCTLTQAEFDTLKGMGIRLARHRPTRCHPVDIKKTEEFSQVLLARLDASGEEKLQLEVLRSGQAGPRAVGVLTGTCREIASELFHKNVQNPMDDRDLRSILLDCLSEHAEDVQGLSPHVVRAAVAAVRRRGGWFVEAGSNPTESASPRV